MEKSLAFCRENQGDANFGLAYKKTSSLQHPLRLVVKICDITLWDYKTLIKKGPILPTFALNACT